MKAAWILAWPDGRFVRVCDEHLKAHNADAREKPPYPRCDELRWSPVRETPECDRCEALRANT